MLALLAGRPLHRRPGRGIARREGLSVVERLGRDLARVIDPHQPRRVPALPVIETVVRGAAGRILRLGFVIHPGRPAQRAVERDDEPVNPVDAAVATTGHWTSHGGATPKSTGHPRAAGPCSGSGQGQITLRCEMDIQGLNDDIRAMGCRCAVSATHASPLRSPAPGHGCSASARWPWIRNAPGIGDARRRPGHRLCRVHAAIHSYLSRPTSLDTVRAPVSEIDSSPGAG